MPQSRRRATATALFATAVLVAAGGNALAASETGFAFLNLAPGVRGAAMGGTGVTTADGPGLVFWNPAAAAPAAARTENQAIGEVGAFHHESILKFRQDIVGGVIRKSRDGLALGFNAHYTEAIEERDALGNLLGSFGSDDFALALGYGALVGEGMRLGGAVQWAREDIAGNTASAISFAGGALFSPASMPRLSFGAALKNLGSSPSFKHVDGAAGESFSQPLTMSLGGTYGGSVGSNGAWLVALDGVKLKGEDFELRAGLEVEPTDVFSLRAGWMFGQDAADLTAGAGIAVGSVQFDYAWVPYHDELGASHRFGLGARF
jgi:hypothetical protein